MNYEEGNDNELLSLISESSEEAKSELIKKYTGIVYSIAKKYVSNAVSLGIEEKDLVQEGFIGLSKAIDTYNVNKNALFYTYAPICIESQMMTALKSANKKRNQSLNSSLSLEGLTECEIVNVNEIMKDEMSDPSIKLIDKENLEEILETARNVLTDFELKVFNLKIEGYDNTEISKRLNKNNRSIENTMFRIKQKLKSELNKK